MEEIGYKEFIKSKPTTIKPMPTKYMWPDIIGGRYGSCPRPKPLDSATSLTLWQKIILNAIQNRIKNRPEYASLKNQKYSCQIEFSVDRNGNINDIHFNKHSVNMTFDEIVEKSLKSLRNERVLNFPNKVTGEKRSMVLDISCPLQDIFLPQDYSQQLYFSMPAKYDRVWIQLKSPDEKLHED